MRVDIASRTPALASLAFILALLTSLAPRFLNAARAAAAADPAAAAGPDSVVARIDGEAVRLGELQDTVRQYQAATGTRIEELNPAERALLYGKLLERTINDRLILKAAARVKVPPDQRETLYRRFVEQMGGEKRLNEELAREGKTTRDVRAMIDQSIRQRAWLEEQFKGKIDVTDEELRRHYAEAPEASRIPEMVRANHILILVPPGSSPEVEAEKRAEIERIHKRLLAGEDFALLAKLSSEDPQTRDLGGDLNFFSRERMVPEFANAAFALDTGELSAPVRTKFGFHLIKVTDRRPARRLTFEESEPGIRTHLSNVKREQMLHEIVEKLRARARIDVYLK